MVIENPNPRDHLRTEWLLANRMGGFAMGTVLGVNTRRYHGLLIAATNPPVGRVVALHSMIEQLVIPREDGTEQVIDLSTQMFVGPDGQPMLHPEGWKHLRRFFCDYHTAIWTFRIGDITVRKHVFPNLNHFENDVRILYQIDVDSDASGFRSFEFRIRPILALRESHSLRLEHALAPIVATYRLGRAVTAAECTVSLEVGDSFHDSPESWCRFAYIEDRERGLDWVEDLWSPGFVSRAVIDRQGATVCVDCKIPNSTQISDRVLASKTAGDQFVVWRSDSRAGASISIIAGYPWFSDWGRDAMISLPGLLLCTKRFDEARSLLHLFASHLRNGLIPNHFDDSTGEPHYNSVDASLWFIHAVREYWKAMQVPLAPGSAGGRDKGWRAGRGDPRAEPGAHGVDPTLLAPCRSIIRAYRDGTDFDIRMDPADGLIAAGNERTQLTWMDAARDGVIFTPRHGKPVEVNALWYNALSCVAEMSNVPAEARELRDLASRVGESFPRMFWWEERRCLHDVLVPQSPQIAIRGGFSETTYAPDSRLRPNQILAVSLPFSPLTREQQRDVVIIVREKLLTPFGLRTLDHDDPDYRGRFEGDLFARDRAYHNGTAWPWLLGPYCDAVLRINDFSDESKREVRAVVRPLLDELRRTMGPGCLGQLAEVYDGDPPQRLGGCVAQAWSVAEIIRIRALIDSESA